MNRIFRKLTATLFLVVAISNVNAAMSGFDYCPADPPTVFNGESTYYTLCCTFNCSYTFSEFPSDHYAAMNIGMYDTARACGACAEVRYGGNSTIVRIVDSCPSCPGDDLDLSTAAFTDLAPLSAGRINVQWNFVECPLANRNFNNVSFVFQLGSAPGWGNIQFQDMLFPVVKVEASNNGGASWTNLTANNHNMWSGFSWPPSGAAIRITDARGNVITKLNAINSFPQEGGPAVEIPNFQFPACGGGPVPTNTFTAVPTNTNTAGPTSTFTNTYTYTAVPTSTFTPTYTYTFTPVATATYTPVPVYATAPFCAGFEGGNLGSSMTGWSANTGRLRMMNTEGPHTGSWHAVMDDSITDSLYGTNALTLHLNLTGVSGPRLEYWSKHWGDEPHALPASWTGDLGGPLAGDSGDGIGISENGVNWFRLANYATGLNWTLNTVDLEPLLATFGDRSQVRIRFIQHDNFTLPSDGYAFDDICVTQSLATSTFTRTRTRTSTPTATRTATRTWTRTSTRTATRTATRTWTRTSTRTSTLTSTPVDTPIVVDTPTSTFTVTSTPVDTPVVVDTPTSTFTVTSTPVDTPIVVDTPTSTFTVTSTPVDTPIVVDTPTSTYTVTLTPVDTPVVADTPTSTFTVTSTPVDTPVVADTPTSTYTVTLTPVDTPVVPATPTLTATVTEVPFTLTSTYTLTSTRTVTVTVTQTLTPTISVFTATPTYQDIQPPLITIDPGNGASVFAGQNLMVYLVDDMAGLKLTSPLNIVSLSGAQGPVSGTISIVGGGNSADLIINPDQDLLSGLYTLTVNACDLDSNCSSQLVTFVVNTPDGPNNVIDAVAAPNPNPSGITYMLAGAVDSLKIKIYTKAMTVVGEFEAGGRADAGWNTTGLSPSMFSGLANGIYYLRVYGVRNGQEGNPATAKLMILR